MRYGLSRETARIITRTRLTWLVEAIDAEVALRILSNAKNRG